MGLTPEHEAKLDLAWTAITSFAQELQLDPMGEDEFRDLSELSHDPADIVIGAAMMRSSGAGSMDGFLECLSRFQTGLGHRVKGPQTAVRDAVHEEMGGCPESGDLGRYLALDPGAFERAKNRVSSSGAQFDVARLAVLLVRRQQLLEGYRFLYEQMLDKLGFSSGGDGA